MLNLLPADPQQARLADSRARQRRRRLWRAVRATLRDTYVLLREFRVPILLFLVVTLGGGWLYGYLWVEADYAPIPYIELPFLMFQMMLIQAQGTMPPHPQFYLGAGCQQICLSIFLSR
jgi:hypothetical protein